MKKIASLLIILAIICSLVSCEGIGGLFSKSRINGTSLRKFSIVYSESDLDYSKRAAEYIHDEIFERTGIDLKLLSDTEPTRAKYEIVVGNTNRPISEKLDENTDGVEFSILAEDNAIALEGNYFVIAAAAYYFIESYVPSNDFEAEIPKESRVLSPIVKDAKSFVILIGDGMGVNQTLLFDHFDNNIEYGDGENEFYGYMLPYMGYSRTDSLSGTTDSAAGGTAISTGHKTINGYVGIDENKEALTSLTELFGSMGKATAVMSTETKSGATPSSFSAHADSRNSTSELVASQLALVKQYGTIINCGYDYYTSEKVGEIEEQISDTLETISADEDGFFIMYEEAHIDKHCHNNNMDKTFSALVRFNQAIARFMEYAFYNPDTFVLITADHETGGLTLGDDGKLSYTSEDHTSANVPIFTWGDGAELFGGQTIENIQIAHTIASFADVYDFGDQSEFTYLK
ncbi:MAG: alkaline phosphatase [Ruminococcaceae bacterium]|nr:alkaline phosphatase [Oscillospiraceae bacterium]